MPMDMHTCIEIESHGGESPPLPSDGVKVGGSPFPLS